ncbi:MAG: hypothetical protein CK428_30005 [Mycobacterium sp.]|nr:MAG: hypothetical protein CK428_30005 [Mycobacterium sp.]
MSRDLSALESWAVANIPALGKLRLFFAEKVGLQTRFTDADWTVVGHLYKIRIKVVRKDPERYVRNRSGPSPAPTWVHGNYPDPTEVDWQRKTVNIVAAGERE